MNHLLPPALPPRAHCLDLMALLHQEQPANHKIGDRIELWVPEESAFIKGEEGGSGRGWPEESSNAD